MSFRHIRNSSKVANTKQFVHCIRYKKVPLSLSRYPFWISSTAMSIYAPSQPTPPWLPRPLKESYIRAVSSELREREHLREDCHSPSTIGPSYAAEYVASIALSPENARCNRYIDVLPYDKSRVILPTGAYLNASWVKELAGGKWTVATQAPLENTVHSFLSMFLLPVTPIRSGSTSTSPPPPANRLRTIVQLTPNVEGRMAKAFPYFPKVVGEEMTWRPPRDDNSPIKVKLLDVTSPEEEGEQPSWRHSVLALSYKGTGDPPHLVRHLHFLVRLLPPPRLLRANASR